MRHNITLTITSLLSVLLMSFHLTQDVLHGVDDPNGIKIAVLILLVWMCGTVILPDGDRGTSSPSSADFLQRPCPSCTRAGRALSGGASFSSGRYTPSASPER